MSLTKLPIEIRLQSAARYYQFQEQKIDTPWNQILCEVESSKVFGIPEVLVLLNPIFYPQLCAPDPRGERAFPAVPKSFPCRSKEVWGYECPFTNAAIHVDHMFPHSKGGSTHPENAMHLCAEHNMSKHTDIHMIPWENFPLSNNWISSSLKHLIKHAQRFSNEKLFFPERQINRI